MFRTLVAFERSGVIRRIFRDRGINAWSCDLQSSPDGSPYHIREDCRNVIDREPWDLIIAHPPCTFLSVSGLHWNTRRPGRAEETIRALEMVEWVLDTPSRHPHHRVRVCVENPTGVISTSRTVADPRIRPADQYVQPYEFGDDASKRTGLWLVGLPTLIINPDDRCHGRVVEDPSTGRMVERWSNQTDSGQNRLGPSEDRADLRAETYPGLAKAMADQWIPYILRGDRELSLFDDDY